MAPSRSEPRRRSLVFCFLFLDVLFFCVCLCVLCLFCLVVLVVVVVDLCLFFCVCVFFVSVFLCFGVFVCSFLLPPPPSVVSDGAREQVNSF